ncbi:GntR family transcriptional regulator [Pseudoduganella sp. RAF53_2]|uniref:GntR family transcriptional regulator n=1 Tax=unclassified Pseudoduganella TaxID=2637179 RepID=UPI003F985741
MFSGAEIKLDSTDTSPLYMQIARKLNEDIGVGRYQVKQALPSERILSEQFNVSRVTIRKAVEELVKLGVVVCIQGSGTFITRQLKRPLSKLSSFTEQMRLRGYDSSSRWLKRAIVTSCPKEQMSLGLSPNDKVVRLERLRLANSKVIAYDLSILPLSAVPNPNVIGDSLYQYLESVGNAPARALQHIRATNAPEDVSEYLGLAAGQAVLLITRIGYFNSGKALELTHSYFRSDYYDFVVEMRR